MKNTTAKAGYGVALILLFLAILSSAPVKAQQMDAAAIKKSTPQQRADWQNNMMKKDLKLTDVQYQQVSKLNLEYAKKMQPLFNSDDSRLSKGMKARSIMKEKDAKLKTILTTSQYDAYQKIVKDKMAAVKKALMDD
jgi:Spy/CpxP family protein refolding chaperone